MALSIRCIKILPIGLRLCRHYGICLARHIDARVATQMGIGIAAGKVRSSGIDMAFIGFIIVKVVFNSIFAHMSPPSINGLLFVRYP